MVLNIHNYTKHFTDELICNWMYYKRENQPSIRRHVWDRRQDLGPKGLYSTNI